jgi:ATP/ADP translocase
MVIGLVVALVWLLTSVGGMVRQDYTPLSVVTPVMLVVTGFLFARKANGN